METLYISESCYWIELGLGLVKDTFPSRYLSGCCRHNDHWKCCSENSVPKLQETQWGKLEAQRGNLNTWGWVRSHHRLAVRESSRKVSELLLHGKSWSLSFDTSIHGESGVWSPLPGLTTSRYFFFVEQLSSTYCCLCNEIGAAWQYLPFIDHHKWGNTSWEVP